MGDRAAVTQYGFFINSDACSGCKTCQVACKDKNNLPVGVHWRRVFEVCTGSWRERQGAWTSTVSVYNLSVSCHHCIEPACAGTCSPGAIWKQENGIVLIDETRCTRCRQCIAVCPYGAIISDPVLTISKCDFCLDEISRQRPPVCVAACPNRALDFGDFQELQKKYGTLNRVFPLPDPSIAKPPLVIKAHRDAVRMQAQTPEIANWEEI